MLRYAIAVTYYAIDLSSLRRCRQCLPPPRHTSHRYAVDDIRSAVAIRQRYYDIAFMPAPCCHAMNAAASRLSRFQPLRLITVCLRHYAIVCHGRRWRCFFRFFEPFAICHISATLLLPLTPRLPPPLPLAMIDAMPLRAEAFAADAAGYYTTLCAPCRFADYTATCSLLLYCCHYASLMPLMYTLAAAIILAPLLPAMLPDVIAVILRRCRLPRQYRFSPLMLLLPLRR